MPSWFYIEQMVHQFFKSSKALGDFHETLTNELSLHTLIGGGEDPLPGDCVPLCSPLWTPTQINVCELGQFIHYGSVKRKIDLVSIGSLKS